MPTRYVLNIIFVKNNNMAAMRIFEVISDKFDVRMIWSHVIFTEINK